MTTVPADGTIGNVTRQPNPPTAPAPSPADVRSCDEWPPGRVLVLAATYCEAENVPALAAAVLAVSPELQLLIVDDDSPDGTGGIALEEAKRNPRLHVLVRRGRRGLGSAIVEGFRAARRHGFEIAVNMDADFSHDPADIPRLLAAIEPAGGRPMDVAIGSRRVPGGGVVGWPISRHVASRLVCGFTRLVLRVPVRDASSGFRAVQLSTFERIDGDFFRGYAFFEHLVWRIHRAGGRMIEVPITFTERVRGESKVNLAEAARGIADLMRLAAATWLRRAV